MQVILLHPRFTNAKSITLGIRHIILMVGSFLLLVLLTAALLCFLASRHISGLPFIGSQFAVNPGFGVQANDKYLKENLGAMAAKLGELQVQLMRLDALGERVQGLAGIKPEEFDFKQSPGRGGIESTGYPTATHQLSMGEFQLALNALASDLSRRADYMNVVETVLMNDKIKSKLLPTKQPVNVNYSSSSFGWRVDPFTGRNAFHEGLDFPASVGMPIVAAAAGVVISAEYHYQYGNMLDIDHGNDIVTRYAHASRLLVKVGDIVQRGQHIADVGTTGRSTGPHLHFEVRTRDVAQDPRKFLAAGIDLAKVAALTGK